MAGLLVLLSALAGGGAAAGDKLWVVGVRADDEASARARLTDLIDIKLYARVTGFAGEVPFLSAPGELVGAPADAFVVAVSLCKKKKDAQALATTTKRRTEGVVLFSTPAGGRPDACLPKRALEPFTAEESALIQAVLKDLAHAKPRTEYAKFLQQKNRLRESEAQLKAALAAEPDDMEAKTLLQVIQVMRQP